MYKYILTVYIIHDNSSNIHLSQNLSSQHRENSVQNTKKHESWEITFISTWIKKFMKFTDTHADLLFIISKKMQGLAWQHSNINNTNHMHIKHRILEESNYKTCTTVIAKVTWHNDKDTNSLLIWVPAIDYILNNKLLNCKLNLKKIMCVYINDFE